MATDLETIKGIARKSLLPDFFGVSVDEEGLWAALRQVLTGTQPAAPNPTVETIKRLAGEATTASDFVEKIKAVNLWMALKELIARVQIK